MTRWRRWGGAVMALGMVAALSGCGQLFAHAQQPTLAEVSNRLDSLDAQVGELQAAVANMGTTPAPSTAKAGGNGVVQSGLPVAVVQAGVLNVRSEPSLSGVIVGTLLQNAEVNVLGESGNWDEISFTNSATGVHLTGWVDADYLGPITTSTSTGSPPAGASSTSATGSATGSATATAGGSSTTTATASGSGAAGSASSGASASTAY